MEEMDILASKIEKFFDFVFAWEIDHWIFLAAIYLVGLFLFAYVDRWHGFDVWWENHPDARGLGRVFLLTWPFLWPLAIVALLILMPPFIALNLANFLDWLIGQLGARRIHADKYGELWRYPHPREPIYQVVVRDDGGRYSLRVPPTMRTAKEAVAWTYKLDSTKYNPEVRT